jgi:hypothetical protein
MCNNVIWLVWQSIKIEKIKYVSMTTVSRGIICTLAVLVPIAILITLDECINYNAMV